MSKPELSSQPTCAPRRPGYPSGRLTPPLTGNSLCTGTNRSLTPPLLGHNVRISNPRGQHDAHWTAKPRNSYQQRPTSQVIEPAVPTWTSVPASVATSMGGRPSTLIVRGPSQVTPTPQFMSMSVGVLTQFGEDPVANLLFLETPPTQQAQQQFSDTAYPPGSGNRVLLETDGTTCALLDTSGLTLPRAQQEARIYQVSDGVHVAPQHFAKVMRAGDHEGHFLVSTTYSPEFFHVHVPVVQPGATPCLKITMFHNNDGQPLVRCEQESSHFGSDVTYKVAFCDDEDEMDSSLVLLSWVAVNKLGL